MSRYTIKQTKSLSTISYEEIEAKVVLENGNVYLVKHDEQGKIYKSLIEKDYEFYKLMTNDEVATQVPFTALLVYVSSGCNLNCPVCYEPKDDVKEPSLEEIENMFKDHEDKCIVLLGREPTCRKDLFKVIRLASKRNYVYMLTNGIKLSDYEYVLKLKESGLDCVFFSFNGFADEIYERMNGRPLLDLKLQALENIKKVGIKTILSATLVRGINEDQIKKLCEFCFDNRSFIVQLRIRTLTPLGRSLEIQPYCMSELIDLVVGALDVRREDILKEHIFWREFLKEIKFFIPASARRYLITRLCSFTFDVKKGKRISPLGAKINIKKIKKSRFKKFLLIYYWIRIFDIPGILYRSSNADVLEISLRCWPNVYNIDLNENKKCTSLYCRNDKKLPFCYYNILEGRKCV